MKKTVLFCIAFCGLFLVSYSCEKDPKPEPTYTNTDLLTKSAWKIEKKHYKAYTDSVFKYDGIMECQWENRLYFYTSGQSEEKYSSDCRIIVVGNGIWWFNDDETVLLSAVSALPNFPDSLRIVKLDEKSLILDDVYTFVNNAGDTLQNITRFEFGH